MAGLATVTHEEQRQKEERRGGEGDGVARVFDWHEAPGSAGVSWISRKHRFAGDLPAGAIGAIAGQWLDRHLWCAVVWNLEPTLRVRDGALRESRGWEGGDGMAGLVKPSRAGFLVSDFVSGTACHPSAQTATGMEGMDE